MKTKRFLTILFTTIIILTLIACVWRIVSAGSSGYGKFADIIINLYIILPIIVVEIEIFYGILYFAFNKEKLLYKTVLNLIAETLAVAMFPSITFFIAFGGYCAIRIICLIIWTVQLIKRGREAKLCKAK